MRSLKFGRGAVLVALCLTFSGCSGTPTTSPSASSSGSSVANASWCGQVDQIAKTESPSVEAMRDLQSAMGSDVPSNVAGALSNGVNNSTITPDNWQTIQTYIEQECPTHQSAP
jgi:hypothetical protein